MFLACSQVEITIPYGSQSETSLLHRPGTKLQLQKLLRSLGSHEVTSFHLPARFLVG